jgi:hypothetical protein
MRRIINIPMDQLPHASSSSNPDSSSSGSGTMPRHTTTLITLPASSRSPITPNPAPKSNTARNPNPKSPRRPSLCHGQSFHSTYSQLAPSIARVQAQPYKPKRPSPLHISTSPNSLEHEHEHDLEEEPGPNLIRTDSGSSSSDESSIGPTSPDLCFVENVMDKGLSPIVEEKNADVNMLGLKLDGPGSGWNWDMGWKLEEAMRLKEPKTPFPSPSLCA